MALFFTFEVIDAGDISRHNIRQGINMTFSFKHPAMIAAAAVAATAVCMVTGCAQEVGDINRVQANYLEKSDFEGTWYYRQTVTEAPRQLDYTFEGYTGTLEKVRWEIREGYLIAYRSYEKEPGTDPEAGEVTQGKTMMTYDENGDGLEPEFFKGQPVAAFRIQSHFDIQRAYNTATGEQSNTIVENYSDRLWNDRKYMRVDWSRNFVAEVFALVDANAITTTSYFVQEQEGGPDAFYKERRENVRNGKKVDELAYFDLVNKVGINPSLRDCWWYNINCQAGEVKLRHSFYRLPEDERDYEPAFYDDAMGNKFGYFRTERQVYDRREGYTDVKRLTLANRHDIWKDDYKRDANGEYLRDANGRAIPTPMAQRTPKPIRYYLSPNFPENMRPYAQSVSDDWDRAFTRAVAQAKNLTNAEVTDQFGKMYILCDNPVTVENEADCDPRPESVRRNSSGDFINYSIRNGDIRYSIMWLVDTPQAAGPLGYGPSHPDPETGEIISGTAYMYGGGLDMYAQSGLDIIQMANGDYTDEEFEAGLDVQQYLEKTLQRGLDPRSKFTEAQLLRMENTPIGDDVGRQILGEDKWSKLQLINAQPRAERFDTHIAKHMQGMDKLRAQGWDKRMLDSEFLGAMTNGKVQDVSKLTSTELTEAMGGIDPLNARSLIERRKNYVEMASNKNIYMADFGDGAVIEVAKRMKEKHGTDYTAAWVEIRGEIFRGVTAHEVGHSIGLRHNFQGSYDALNYFDEYWDFRKDNLPVLQSQADILKLGKFTDEELDAGIQNYQYSSIMDYHARFNGDWAGIGKYDEAAILFGYTFGTYEDIAEGSDPTTLRRENYFYTGDATAGQTLNTGSIQEPGYVEYIRDTNLPQAGRDLLYQYDRRRAPSDRSLLENNHYSTAVTTLGGADILKERDYIRYSVLKPKIDQNDPSRPAEVPYMYCSDEIAGALVSCNRWDLGADPIEIVDSARDNYYTYYPLTNFRRNRTFFSYSGALNNAFRTGRTFLTVYQQYLLGSQDIDDNLLSTIYFIAMGSGFNTIAQTMARPRYGYYAEVNGELVWDDYEREDAADTSTIYIPRGQGRRLRSLYDDQSGYFYFARMSEAGHFWDWLGMLFTAIEPTARTVAVDTAADRQAFTVPYYIFYEEELTKMFNGYITNDLQGLESFYDDSSKTLTTMPPVTVDFGGGLIIDPSTQAPVVTAPAGSMIRPDYNLNQQYYSAVYGSAYFNALYSTHFVDQSRVFKIGNGQQVQTFDNTQFELASFTDPVTGLSYGTIVPIVQVGDVSLGKQLIDRAQGLIVALEQPGADTRQLEFELSNVVETINMVADIVAILGSTF